MIDIRKYRILTPAVSTLNLNSDITVYLRNDEVETVSKDCTDKINLSEIAGVQCPEFNLVFKNHDNKFIKECQRSEDWLQGFYYMFDFETGDWVEVTQHNELTFFDALYGEEDVEVEDSQILY